MPAPRSGVSHPAPGALLPASERALRASAQARLGEIAELLGSLVDFVRHAAAYALAHSDDERAVEPLVGLLCHQQDFFDHDFAYGALRQLGRRALRRLERFALEGSEEEAFQAVQALGQSSADALPCLRRVLAARSPLPKSFFCAYYNLHDPRGLPDLLPALRSSDPRLRCDALFAAATLLEEASKRSRRRPRSASAFADAIAPLVECPRGRRRTGNYRPRLRPTRPSAKTIS